MPLHLSWPPLLFDEDLGQCLTSLPHAQRKADYKAAAAAAGGTLELLAKQA